jgi:hypothetical protein
MPTFIVIYSDVLGGTRTVEADHYDPDGDGWMGFFVERENDSDLLVASIRADLTRSIEMDRGIPEAPPQAAEEG